MAMNEVQIGRYQHLLERLLALKGEISAQQLSPELIPVLNLGNDRPEWAALGNEHLAWGRGAQAAVAGERSAVLLWNRTTSGALGIIRDVFIYPASAMNVQIGWGPEVAGGGYSQAASGFRDARIGQGATAAALLCYNYRQVGSPITSVLWQSSLFNSTTTHIPNLDIVLPPGTALYVAGAADNTSITVCFVWRERKLEPQEDTLG